MPTSKQSHPPVTKSAICPNCGIAQVMYDARLVDSFKEEDRKFDRRPQTNHHDHQNFLIIITFSLSQPLFEANMNIIITNLTSSLSQLFGTTLQPFVAPNLLTTWTNAPQIEIWPIFGDRGDKISEKNLVRRYLWPWTSWPTKVCNCSNILVVEYLHMRQWLKKITRSDILIVFYSKSFQYFNWID